MMKFDWYSLGIVFNLNDILFLDFSSLILSKDLSLTISFSFLSWIGSGASPSWFARSSSISVSNLLTAFRESETETWINPSCFLPPMLTTSIESAWLLSGLSLFSITVMSSGSIADFLRSSSATVSCLMSSLVRYGWSEGSCYINANLSFLTLSFSWSKSTDSSLLSVVSSMLWENRP